MTRLLPIVDYRTMQKVGEILGKKYGNLTKVIRIRDRWDEIAGEVLASPTEPVKLKGKILYVLCDSPAWVQQIDILSSTLQPRIKKLARLSVDKIVGAFGMARKNKEKVRMMPVLRRPDIDPADIEAISDPGLKRAIMELIDMPGDENG